MKLITPVTCIFSSTLHLLDDLQEYLTTLEQNILGLANYRPPAERTRQREQDTGLEPLVSLKSWTPTSGQLLATRLACAK